MGFRALERQPTKQGLDNIPTGWYVVVMSDTTQPAPTHPTRAKILDAAIDVIRTRGYAGTRVEDVCEAAGVTKGAFFHHFKSKEELAVAAADRWSEVTGGLFDQAPFHQPADPLDRVLAYVEFRREIIDGETPAFTCLVGTMAQETHVMHPAIRDAAWQSISAHARTLVADIAAAKEKYAPGSDIEPESLALFTQATLQGAFILAKAKDDPQVARDMVDHLRRYIELLFGAPKGEPE